MMKTKHIVCTIFIFALFSLSMSTKARRIPKIEGEVSKRHLQAAEETLIARVYLGENFQGDAYDIVSGAPRWFENYNGVVSIQVGAATLRIIDWDNYWVYRFAPGEQLKKFKLNAGLWSALIGKPRCVLDDCVMLFQRPNYSGYFQELYLHDGIHDVLLDADFVNGQLFERRYTSFTLPADDSVTTVALLGENNEFQVFNFRSAFSGDLNYIYIFGELNSGYSYAFIAKTLSYQTVDVGSPVTTEKGKLFLVAGEFSYAKFTGDTTSVTITRDRPFDYFYATEPLLGQVRYLYDLTYGDCAVVYSDADGFNDMQAVCSIDNDVVTDEQADPNLRRRILDGETNRNEVHSFKDKDPEQAHMNELNHTSKETATASYVDSPFSYASADIGYVTINQYDWTRAYIVKYANSNSITFTSSGRIPVRENDHATDVILVPWEDETPDNAYIYSGSPNFDSDAYLVQTGFNYYGIEAFQSGYKSKVVYLVNQEDNYNINVYQPGSIVQFYDENILNHYIAYFDLQDAIDDVFSQDEDYNCVYLYNTCNPQEFADPKKVCITDTTDYESFDLADVKYVAFYSDFVDFTSVLLYREDSFDGQFTLTKSTCLVRALSKDMKITLIPDVEDNNLHVYTKPFYNGERFILNPDDQDTDNDRVIIPADTNIISLAFGLGATAKIINIAKREVFTLDFNVPKYHTHGDKVTVESGDAPVVNTIPNSLWTFDDKNYQDMRVLYGGHFYGESQVSYRTQYLAFPEEGVNKAILVDRRNSIIQVYDYAPGLGLVSVDHTTFGGIERVILIDEAWDTVLLARYANFGEYKDTLKRSDIVRLGNGRHYSFISSHQPTDNLRLIAWPLLNNLKYNPADAVKDYGTEQYIEQSFTVGLSGIYGFVQGDEWPINVLYDCFITFDAIGPNCETQTNIRRFCIRSRGIQFENFELKTQGAANVDNADFHLLILLTTNNEDFKVSRKYSGITFDGELIEESTCKKVDKNDSYTVKFEKVAN